jgi:hypothetical protein
VRRRAGLALALLSLVVSACGRPVVYEVEDGVYRALVPSAEQFEDDGARGIPGGFASLRETGINLVELTLEGDDVTFRLDGKNVVTRKIVDHLIVRDREGSGPFKAEKELLVLGNEPLVVGGLSITEPVVWPGSFEGSPVITVKSRDPEERGPGVSCRADEQCLLLSSGVDPTGRYEDANNPRTQRESHSVDPSIRRLRRVHPRYRTTGPDQQEWRVIDGRVRSVRDRCVGRSHRGRPCHARPGSHPHCPSSPGGAIQLIVMPRAQIPALAPLGAGTDGIGARQGPTACGLPRHPSNDS